MQDLRRPQIPLHGRLDRRHRAEAMPRLFIRNRGRLELRRCGGGHGMQRSVVDTERVVDMDIDVWEETSLLRLWRQAGSGVGPKILFK